MLVLVWLLILMMMTGKSDAGYAEIITARSGEAILLTPDLQGAVLEPKQDVRWTHPYLVVALKNKTCRHGRCELLPNGSLSFSHVQTADSGNYSLEVFDERGKQLMKRHFLLRVEAGSSSSSSSSSSVVVTVLICCFHLLLFIIIIFIIFIVRRRRSQRTRTAGPLQENVYVAMHSHHGNKGNDEEEKQEREDESSYVACNPVVSMETPIAPQMSGDVEDIYV